MMASNFQFHNLADGALSDCVDQESAEGQIEEAWIDKYVRQRWRNQRAKFVPLRSNRIHGRASQFVRIAPLETRMDLTSVEACRHQQVIYRAVETTESLSYFRAVELRLVERGTNDGERRFQFVRHILEKSFC